MRIGFLSTYPPTECGIATYTQYLSSALREGGNEIFVISQYGAEGRNVFPIYQTGSLSFASDVFTTSTRMTPDLMHIQHEYGLYGTQRGVAVIDLIIRYRLAGIPVAITLHTVYDSLKREERIILKTVLGECAAVIVHENYQKQTLVDAFKQTIADIDTKIHVIEHGVRELPPIPDAKKKLELEGKKVILLCGYFRPSKGFHKIVNIFPNICRKEEDAALVVAGKTRNIEYDDYRRELFTSLNGSPVADKITILRGQFPQHTFDTIIAAADVVVLPYEVGAQSGMLAQCFAQVVPVVTSDLPAFKLIIDRSGGGVTASSDADYEDRVLDILRDEALSTKLKNNISNYISKEAGWSHTANLHCDVYREIITTPYGKAKYVYFPEPEA
jgi:1,2-diacylglycerol 3-alpha-glucosyltransferase